MSYSVLEVANVVIKCYDENRSYITWAGLNPVLYFIQGEFLVETGRCCFREDIIARDEGPRIDAIDREFSRYGGGKACPVSYMESTMTKEDIDKVRGIVDQCLSYSDAGLMELAKSQPPYTRTYVKGFPFRILPEYMRNYFSE